MINDEIKADLKDNSDYYCSDICESRDEDCDNCSLDGFLTWLDTQTE
jgi:hypothetical protein